MNKLQKCVCVCVDSHGEFKEDTCVTINQHLKSGSQKILKRVFTSYLWVKCFFEKRMCTQETNKRYRKQTKPGHCSLP